MNIYMQLLILVNFILQDIILRGKEDNANLMGDGNATLEIATKY